MMRAAFSRFGLATVLALTLALLAVGFAHHVPRAEDGTKFAYLLAGGTTAELCGQSSNEAMGKSCPACHLTATVVLPANDLPPRLAALSFERAVIAPRVNRAARMVRDPALGLRAPPIA